MKKIYLSILFLLLMVQFKTYSNCPVNTAPTNINTTSVCNVGYSTFSASLNDISNTLVWLDSANRIIGTGNNFKHYISNTGLNFKVAESGYDLVSAKVGPLSTSFNSTYPSQNFSNGQYFSCLTSIRIDSILLRSNNPLNGFIQIWSNSPENGGYILQKIPFNITKTGDANTRVAIKAILNTGNYFINTEITSGTGILYRSTSGAVYPYTASNLLSITGSNFTGATNRYYYFFDWDISKMCIGPASANFSPTIVSTKPEVLPYKETFNQNLPCDWTLSSNNAQLNWEYGNSTLFSSPNFIIPSDSGILISSALNIKLERKSLVNSPWFDLRNYSKDQDIKLKFNYEYLNSNSSKAYVYLIDSRNRVYLKDSLIKQTNTFALKTIDLRNVVLLDSIRIVFEHKEAVDSISAFAIKDLEIESGCEISYIIDLTTDKFGSEISWEIRDQLTRELIASNSNFKDIDPYNPFLARNLQTVCLKKGKEYTFKIMDLFGDGLDDGVNTGKYLFKNNCGDTVLFGSGAFPFGGQVLPELAWDSIVFKAQEYKVNLGPDLTVNVDDSVILDGGDIGPYYWSTGDTTRYLTVKNKNKLPGIYGYTLIVRNNDLLCRSKDTILVTFIDVYNPNIIVNLTTDTKGSEIKWELRDTDADTIVFAKGPFIDIIPYNTNAATHIDTIKVAYGQNLKFKIIDIAGNGLNDGTNQGRVVVRNECSPVIFENKSISFPFSLGNIKFDSILFTSNERPNINLGNNFSICVGDSVTLDAGAFANAYEWSNGKTTKSIVIKSSELNLGDNLITLSTEPGVCNVRDSVRIFVNTLPNAGFNTTQNGGDLTASGIPGATLYSWDFGDGSNANGLNVTHTYKNNGSYIIVLNTVNSVGCIASSSKTVTITGVGFDEKNINKKIEIYPNPNAGILFFNTVKNDNYIIKIFNVQGELLIEEEIITNSKEKSLDISQLPNGIYMVQVFGSDILLNKKLIIEK